MVKRQQIHNDDDEVEIVSTSWSNSNPFAINSFPTVVEPRPNAKKRQPAGPSFAAPDPHPFSYPPTNPPVSVSVPVRPEVRAQPRAGPSTASGTNEIQPPPKKKQRTTKKKIVDPDTPVPEKRGAIFKKACPKNILDRVDRVMSQRFFMVDRMRMGEELREEFKVLGSTGNVYTVIIDKIPSCNCPDATKGNHCKHILFIYLKVLQVPQHSGLWYQKALLKSELQTIFNQAPPAPNSVAHARVREAYAKATGKTIPAASSSTSKTTELDSKKRIPGPDDDCPICYEGMHGAKEAKLTWCEECGNALHTECFEQWARTAQSAGQSLTCVWCRAKWILPRASSTGGAGSSGANVIEGYINLGDVAGLDDARDTSTYYHGPRKGRRYYGYQDYW